MILKPSEIRAYGMRIEEKISEDVINGAITNAELQVLKPIIGNDIFNSYCDMVEEGSGDAILSGGKFITADGMITRLGGLKMAIANIAYSFILRNQMVASAFGSVLKRSEQSEHAEIQKYAKSAYEIGLNYIYEVCDALGMKDDEIGKSQYQEWCI